MNTSPSRLLSRMSDQPTLWAAWSRVAAGTALAGADGVTVAEFAHHLGPRLESLSALLRSGEYTPQPLRLMTVTRGGERRDRGIPTVADRVAQRAFLHVAGDRWETRRAEVSFAYQRGRSWVDALTMALAYRDKGLRYVVRADIADFFASVDHQLLHEMVSGSLADPAVSRIVRGWFTAPMLTAAGLRTRVRGVPEGAPISPTLANLYLREFDARVDGRHGRLVRYADDLALFCLDLDAAISGARQIGAELAALNLRLHPDKTQITTFDAGFSMLGWVFDGEHGRPEQPNADWTHPLLNTPRRGKLPASNGSRR
ncbi:reverse transcriptase domain-containing protein [Micromonospora sp. LOL_014]|uniref:reverse transcriptase domain-containing protein n=1 Tax=Micromonospora sp. LOL_014 TaxID=3345415 RepID=UPI003A877C76